MVAGSEHDSIDELFVRQVRPYVFGGHHPSAAPRLVLLGAQPGAGKSHTVARILAADPATDYVYVTGDALRPLDPQYVYLLRTDPLAMPNATGPTVARWVRACIDHALTRRYSLILEGTFRDPDVVAATLRRFAKAGYHTEAVVLAVRPERSRLDCLLRWLGTDPKQPARWTPPSAHDTTYSRLPATVAALTDVTHLHRISIHTRTRIVFTDDRDADGHWRHPHQASAVLHAEHHRPFDADAATAWLDQYQWAIETSTQLPTLDTRAISLYRALVEDADRVAAMANPDPAHQRRRQHAQVQHRAAALLTDRHPSPASTTGPGPSAGRAFPPVSRVAPEGSARTASAPPIDDPPTNRRHRR